MVTSAGLSCAKLDGVGMAVKELVETVASTISKSSPVISTRDFIFGFVDTGMMTSSTSSTGGFSCLMPLLAMRKMAGCCRDLKCIEVSLPNYRREMHFRKELERVGRSRTLEVVQLPRSMDNLKTKDSMGNIKRSEKVKEVSPDRLPDETES
jgi:hypothetical protein